MSKIRKIISAQQMLDIISPIPKDKFCTNFYQNSIGQCCFLGHIHRAMSGTVNGDDNGFGARQLTRQYLQEKHGIDGDGSAVNNNNNVNDYIEPVIKDRIMHLLTDMVNDGY